MATFLVVMFSFLGAKIGFFFECLSKIVVILFLFNSMVLTQNLLLLKKNIVLVAVVGNLGY